MLDKDVVHKIVQVSGIDHTKWKPPWHVNAIFKCLLN